MESKTTNKEYNNHKSDHRAEKWGAIGIALLSGVIGGFLALAVFGQGNNVNVVERNVVQEQSAIIEAVEQSRPSVVSIVGTKTVAVRQNTNDFFSFFFEPNNLPENNIQEQEQQVSAGTGFFVTNDGLIATNKHVVADESAQYSVFTNDGKRHDAQVVAKDPVNDIALLKINSTQYSKLELGNSDNLQIGQVAIAIGNALGEFRNTVTTGVVSGIERTIVATGGITGAETIEGAIQTDAAINPGNSGGPLLDITGKVIGINTAISAEGQLLGFAIPVNELKKDIEIYERRDKIVKPFIGIRYIMITDSLAEQRNLPVEEGALITADTDENAIVPGSPAERAGLRAGDIILSINGEDVNLENSVGSILRDFHPGDIINMTVLRDNKEINIRLELGERSS